MTNSNRSSAGFRSEKAVCCYKPPSSTRADFPFYRFWLFTISGPTNYLYHYEDQVKNIVNLVLGTSELDEEGFSKEIGIVGIGDYGETLVAQSVFDQSPVGIVGIWINLQAIQKGEIDFKKILKAMLKQCDGGQRDSVEVEELLEALCKALWSKSYILVFDGIWDINLDWYFRLKERLQWCNKSNQSRLIIITTRLDGVAKRMVGPNNLYRIQPFSDEDIWLNIETFISA
ncbi:hypothetical protein VitviT2T_018312 [Vitis vinifera]|uniref:NB-ARC domain-containing protein n=1 Tax=Vitis vinifera TaxID=29760 RepID=A0ABY9CXM2_VITVI|nr:hypothetical protein VitviT2T_018312 [Vitis vinifera]